ncbi:two-component system, NtrC family, sensor kinase [Geoalkalibacter ferrihydriticus]|uniref:histidine kinase n=2 Tax=Geoalkalibacter ferrihydriticus TaxID=392333 RepID=A0A0C2ECB5_9BACT|nr:ATP-binding protein [Geoalkalibacter ferrihydriticus]KIH76223.1 histidine kinase [Geoalkalibacter ferrihydriticus DSM 17813]SDL26415.1 two-component system, NtrC family, sensor kinase [Geoalkalibacter ferrihydriticus]
MRVNLITKVTLVTGVVLLVAMVLFAFINVTTLKKIFLEEAIHDVDNLSETLIRSTHYQMLEDDRKRVYQMIQEVGTQRGIEHIRLINKDGEITFSTERAEIGTILDKNTEGCNVCHAEDTPLIHASSMNRSRIFADRDGKEVLGMARAIYNQESCATADCHFHPPDLSMVGILDVIVSLDGMHMQTATYRNNIIVLTLMLLLIVASCLTLVTQRFITNPLSKLLHHTQRIAQGDWSPVELKSHDEFGKLAGAFNDMTHNLKQAQDELAQWGSQLEAKVEERTHEIKNMQSRLIRSEKVASLGELVAGIAHELNNPLTGVLMFSSMIAEDPRLDPALKPDFDTIIHETQRCAEIVRGLLDFARESVPQKSHCAVEQVLEQTLILVSHHSSFHDIRVERDYGSPPQILADPNQLEQVFMNLLINASQAMENGGTLKIKTGTLNRDAQVFVKISDSGCGIAEENLTKIFDPFFSTKGHKGTGLGLSVSYGIIENHGGKIEVQSRMGEGTTFTVLLPASFEQKKQRAESGLAATA